MWMHCLATIIEEIQTRLWIWETPIKHWLWMNSATRRHGRHNWIPDNFRSSDKNNALTAYTFEVGHYSVAGVKHLAASVTLSVCLDLCLSVRTIIQNRMIPNSSNLVYGLTLGFPAGVVVFKSKGQRSRSQGHKVRSSGRRMSLHSIRSSYKYFLVPKGDSPQISP